MDSAIYSPPGTQPDKRTRQDDQLVKVNIIKDPSFADSLPSYPSCPIYGLGREGWETFIQKIQDF